MIDLERSLAELAERLEIPGGEWLVDDVLRRIAEPAPRRSLRRRVPRLAGALALALVVVVVASARSASCRRPLAGIRQRAHRTGRHRADARDLDDDCLIDCGSSTVATSAEPDAGPGRRRCRSTRRCRRPACPIQRPTLLGHPQSVHVVQPPASGQIVLVYAPSDLVPQSEVTGVGALVSVMPAHDRRGVLPQDTRRRRRRCARRSRRRQRLLDRGIAAPVDVRDRRRDPAGHAATGDQHAAVATRRSRLSHRGRHRPRDRRAGSPTRCPSSAVYELRLLPSSRRRRCGWRRRR